MPNLQRMREKLATEEGSVSSHAIALGIGAVAVGVALFAFRGCSVVSVEPKTQLKIDAKVVADEINLPASLNVVSIKGGSSSKSEIGIDVGVGIGSFSRDIPIGSIIFPTSVYGEDSIEYDVLKDSANNTTKPNALNTDKNIKLSVEQENGKDVLVIEADPIGFSANTKNIRAGEGTVVAEGLISSFRSVPPEIAAQIATGANDWNVENFRLSCAKDITSQNGVVEAGLAKSIAVEIQVITPFILKALADKYPDHPEVLDQATKYIADLSDPANMRVRFVTDPNNPKAGHTPSSKKTIDYMQASNLTGSDMAQKIGLNNDYLKSITLNDSSSTCNLSDEARKDIQDILATWRAQTPYDDTKVDKLNADASK